VILYTDGRGCFGNAFAKRCGKPLDVPPAAGQFVTKWPARVP
jgi:hypothetical protein